MRIGILTLHFANNYGAVLQAYGLQHRLRAMGHDVEILDYVPKFLAGPSGGWRKLARRVRRSLWPGAHLGAFMRFRREHLRLSPNFAAIEDLWAYCEDLEVLVVGSDQIWNWAKMPHVEPAYVLAGAPQSCGRVGYAPCCGQPDQPEQAVVEATRWLRRFDAIGARHAFGQALYERVARLEVPVVSDPACLCDFADLGNAPTPDGRYVLAFGLDERLGQLVTAAANNCRRELSARLVTITPGWRFADGDQAADGASPAQWLELIRNASCVITDSFHGAVFSIKFGRPLIACAFQGDFRYWRLHDLLSRYSGSECLSLHGGEPVLFERAAAGTAIRIQQLNRHASESIEFIRKSLATAGGRARREKQGCLYPLGES